MTTPAEIVTRAICKNLHTGLRVLAPDDDLRADLRGTDISILSALMDIEDALDVEVQDHEAEGLRTVGDVQAMVFRKLGVEA